MRYLFFLFIFFFSWQSLYSQSQIKKDNVYETTLKQIAKEIGKLKPKYPQLKSFSMNNLDLKQLRITYSHDTHRPKRTGGWTSGVPNPNDHGIWFFIDFHNHDSVAQIHNQPMRHKDYTFKDKAFTFLILQGKKTSSVSADFWKIFREKGIQVQERIRKP